MKKLTAKQVRVLELAMDVCEQVKNEKTNDDVDMHHIEKADSCFNLLEEIVDWSDVKSKKLRDEPE